MTTLTAHQEDAVRAVSRWFSDPGQQVFYLSGPAGSGKSTLLPFILESCGLRPEEFAIVAPTGKAAKVASSKLVQQGIRTTCMTIHKAIYIPRAHAAEMVLNEIDSLDYRIEEAERRGDGTTVSDLRKTLAEKSTELDRLLEGSDGPKFKLNPDSIVKTVKLIVCDEAGMVGSRIAEDLLSFGVPILAVGDDNQLPPVKDDPGLTLHGPDFLLTEIHRQAQDSPIIHLATLARTGKAIPYGSYGDGVDVVSKRDDDATLDMGREAQVLCGTNKSRWSLTRKIRRALGYHGLPPMAGEPMIVCQNSKAHPDLVNGSFVSPITDVAPLTNGGMYYMAHVKTEDGHERSLRCYQGLIEEHQKFQKGYATAPNHLAFKARIEGEHLDWGWVITTHKAQGSGWPDVIVHNESSVFKSDGWRWLYTAITRAEQKLTLVT